MDVVLDGVSETHALLGRLRIVAQGLEQAGFEVETLIMQPVPVTDPLRRRLAAEARALDSTVDQMDRELRQLRDATEQLRFVPAGSLFTPLERMVRDTAQTLSKQVAFEGKGGAIRLDAQILETMRNALMQIMRNALAHGIETPAERRAQGKPETGHVSIEIAQRGHQIVFKCRDDGRGIDLDAIRMIAQQRGLLDPNATTMNGTQMLQLLMQSGISTARSVTEVSGRGVGLDVVQSAVSELGGHAIVETEPGRGTTFQLIVPRARASAEALMVKAAGRIAAIPQTAVRRCLRLAAGDLSEGATGISVLHEQGAIPFVPLAAMLEAAPPATSRDWTAVVIAGGAGSVAIGVDRILETVRIITHPIPDHIAASPILGGAMLDAEGNPQLVLDPDGLVAEAQRGATRTREQVTEALSILVVDDSLTTRMLEQSILESAGYRVALAVSGEEALARLARERHALVLSDVEMPGMNGFTLIERLRADSATRTLPAILVTSLDSPEFRQRGTEAGAQGYIVKSEFDQAKLLAMIKAHTS
jgi:two-component system chemotaxis sensor kinase CheA